MYVRVDGGRVRVPRETELEGDEAVALFVSRCSEEDVLPFVSARGAEDEKQEEVPTLVDTLDEPLDEDMIDA